MHSWIGVAGPRPTLLSIISVALLASIFAHLVFELPSWWPYAAGGVAIAFNLVLAYWQAGTVRVVEVTSNGIQVLRKGRWSTECTHLLGSMPRMPLGPLGGRWCRSSIANTVIWVHRRYHPAIATFDAEYRGLFADHDGGLKVSGSGRVTLE